MRKHARLTLLCAKRTKHSTYNYFAKRISSDEEFQDPEDGRAVGLVVDPIY